MNHPENLNRASEDREQSGESSSFGDILSEFEHQQQAVPRGEAIPGTIVAITDESVFVDIGRKTEGVFPVAVFRDTAVKPGDPLLVSVTGRDPEGYYTLSTVKVERPKDWSSLETAFAERTVIAGMVEEVIKGGLRVDVGVRAFLPASRSGAREQADLESLVGQEIRCRIIKLDVAAEDVVVDRRTVLEEEESRSRAERFATLQEGAVVRGSVRNLTDFGAFVDLGGIDGLLHVTDMSWGRAAKPSDVVSVGEEVEVKILKVDSGSRRISLGLKQLAPDPWSLAAEKYQVGERVRGVVTRLTDFGVFVELEPGVEGLIHISEMSWSRKIRKPSDVVKSGEAVEAVILSVNPAERRIGLGLKQTLGDPWEEAERKFTPGSVVEGPVTNLAKFGAFVELGEGIEGMIHIGDISREKRLTHPKEALAVGQSVRAAVLEVDREKRRIRLGMKQLEPTTVDEYIAEHECGQTVTGRIVDVGGGKARVELGEGVIARCRLASEAAESQGGGGGREKADLSSLTAMLSARWKQGGAAESTRREPARPGQVRSFRILTMDPAQKSIEVELLS